MFHGSSICFMPNAVSSFRCTSKKTNRHISTFNVSYAEFLFIDHKRVKRYLFLKIYSVVFIIHLLPSEKPFIIVTEIFER